MKKSVVFYLYAINGRGQSKVLIDVAAGLAKAGYGVTICCTQLIDSIYIEKYKDIINLKLFKASNRILALVRLRQYLIDNSVDVLISGGTDNNCTIVLASKLLRKKPLTIITEHTSLVQTVKNSKRKMAWLLKFAAKFFYPKSNVLVSVSNSLQDELFMNIGVSHINPKVIFNPVISQDLIEMSFNSISHPWLHDGNKVFLGVGQITEQKNFFGLVDAFNLIKDIKDFKLIILGDGPDKESLQEYIKNLGLDSDISLLGRVNNPYAYMRQSDAFVLSSKWEGLPTVLIEALACGVPVVATDCPHGPKEILEGGKWGDLVPVSDSRALADAMLRAVDKPKESCIDRANDFTYEASVMQYIDLIESLS